MANHSNRPKSQDIGKGYTIYRLDGDTMEAGYIADLRPNRIYVVKDPDGKVWAAALDAPILNIRTIKIDIYTSANGTWTRLFDRRTGSFIGRLSYGAGPLIYKNNLVCYADASIGYGFSANDSDVNRVGWL